jgi:hypothetical protein
MSLSLLALAPRSQALTPMRVFVDTFPATLIRLYHMGGRYCPWPPFTAPLLQHNWNRTRQDDHHGWITESPEIPNATEEYAFIAHLLSSKTFDGEAAQKNEALVQYPASVRTVLIKINVQPHGWTPTLELLKSLNFIFIKLLSNFRFDGTVKCIVYDMHRSHRRRKPAYILRHATLFYLSCCLARGVVPTPFPDVICFLYDEQCWQQLLHGGLFPSSRWRFPSIPVVVCSVFEERI